MWKPVLYYTALVSGILWISFFGRPADADEYERHHQSDVWQSGKMEGRRGVDPSGQDMNDAYMLDYMEGREEARHEELLDAIEEARDE